MHISNIRRFEYGSYTIELIGKNSFLIQHVSRLKQSQDGIDHWEWSGLKELEALANASQINSIMVIIEKLMEIEESGNA